MQHDDLSAEALAKEEESTMTKKPAPKKPASKKMPTIPKAMTGETIHPKAFLNMARDYADAANELFMKADARPKIRGRHLPFDSERDEGKLSCTSC
jgi:hypothetical protein